MHLRRGNLIRIEIGVQSIQECSCSDSGNGRFSAGVVATKNEGNKKSENDYIFEPDKEAIVQDLIPRSLKTQFYKALLDSHAAEHGARMTSYAIKQQ